MKKAMCQLTTLPSRYAALFFAVFATTLQGSYFSVATVVDATAMHASPPYSSSLNPLVIKGTKFFDSATGDEVVIRGVDYYPRPNAGDLNANSIDLFTETHAHVWQRDIPYLQALGINAIRIYAVNASQNHDGFMCAMERAGIYVVVALSHDCPTCAITRDEAPKCYPPALKEQGMAVISAFSKYSNTLAFSAGNEVNHVAPPGQPEWNAPCQKKFLSDMRHYIASCSREESNGFGSMRKIPVGLVVADTDREDNAMYYNCHDEWRDQMGNLHNESDNEYAEFYGLNSYVACNGTANAYNEFLGLEALQQSFASYNYSIPVLLTEFGCISDSFPTIDEHEGQRNFLEARFLLEQPALRDTFAGGLVFEYSMEYENAKGESPFPFKRFGKQNYGLGYLQPEDCDDLSTPCDYVPFPSFNKLSDAFQASRIVNQTRLDKYEPTHARIGRSKCPSHFPRTSSFEWEADKVIPFAECPRRQDLSYKCLYSVKPHDRTGDSGIFSKAGMKLPLIVAALLVAMVSFMSLRRPKIGYEEVDIAVGPSNDEWHLNGPLGTKALTYEMKHQVNRA